MKRFTNEVGLPCRFGGAETVLLTRDVVFHSLQKGQGGDSSRRPNQGYRQPGGKDNPKSGNPPCCRILLDGAGDCRILPDIAGDCRKLHAGPRGLDIAGYCRILPDFAGFCKNIAGYCRMLPDETSGKVRQRSATFGNIRQQWVCRILPDITS